MLLRHHLELGMEKKQDLKTGIFLQKSSEELLVMWKGKEICRYASICDFVDAHADGIAALEANQEELLENYYKSLSP